MGWGTGSNDEFDRCLYGKSLIDIQLEYLNQFWKKYNDMPKFFMLDNNYGHEPSGELLKYLDDPLEKFLREFYKQENFKNTEILIIADHGAHFLTAHAPFVPDNSRAEETFLPVFLILAHKDAPVERLQFLRENQQQFLNSLDIYGILKAIAVGKQNETAYPRYYAPQYEALPKNRDCTDGDGIKYKECWCRNDVSKLEDVKAKHWIFYIYL